jgi:homoserine dehydrogenase
MPIGVVTAAESSSGRLWAASSAVSAGSRSAPVAARTIRDVVPQLPAGKPLRVALLGLGSVGRPVAERLLDAEWRANVTSRGLTAPELVAIGVRDPDRPRGVALPASVRRTEDLAALAAGPDIDVVVELIGGTGDARTAVEVAIAAGRNVVTGNKALLATFGPGLEADVRAAHVSLRFEAAVAGGVPVLGPLVHDLAANRIDAVRGIVNGTTNHMLSAMARDGRTYDDVLDEAKARGYAESDPSGDVEGMDAANKLAILARLAFGEWPDVTALRRAPPAAKGDALPGITAIKTRELARAADLGLTLKLVARAERPESGGFVAAVTPAAVPLASALGQTIGVTNLVEVIGSPVGRVAFRGPGAGGDATSSAVLADILALARGEGSTWEPLPPAAAATHVPDDLGEPRAWFFAAPDLVGGHVPPRITEATLVISEGAIVTRPMALDELRMLLADFDYTDVTLYPVLEMGRS